MNPLIALSIKNPEIMSPFQLASGAQDLRSGDINNRLNERKLQQSYEPTKLSQKEILENALQKYAYVGQMVKGFVDKPYSPETDMMWRKTKAQIEKDLEMPIPDLPDKFDPMQVKMVYDRGMNNANDMRERYKLISTTSGFKRVDMLDNKAEDIGGTTLMAPNASPELQYQMQKAKEAPKGVDVTDETGATYRAPQEQANPAFAPQGNNYGNIRPQGQSTGFQKFSTPEEGLSAIDKNLQAYGSKGINTLEGVISRWAPPNENDTARLIGEASKRLGINPNQPIDLNNPAVRQAVSTAIMYQEQGPKGIFGVVKSPGLAQQEQTKANIAIDKTRQEEQIKRESALGKESDVKIRDSKEALGLLDNIDRLIDYSTGSGAGAMADSAGRFVGLSTEGAKANAAIQTSAKKLVMMMPRGAGPQSDRDVQLAEQMAGNLSNPDIPIAEKRAALAELKRVTSAYIPGAEVQSGYQPKGARSTEDLLKLYGGE